MDRHHLRNCATAGTEVSRNTLKFPFTPLLRILQQRRITPDTMGHEKALIFGAK
jgi:hypothetical protein